MILILKAGSTRPGIKEKLGDFEDWIKNKMGLKPGEYEVFDAGNYKMAPRKNRYSSIIITGSQAMVTEVKPAGSPLCNWLLEQQNRGTYILGICYGHQLLAYINGGKVSYNSEGMVFGMGKTCLTEAGNKDDLFSKFSDVIDVYKAHKQIVVELPVNANILSRSRSGLIDSFRIKNAWGVQFHPEFDQAITESYLDEQAHIFYAEGLDVDHIRKKLIPANYGKKFLKSFRELSANHTLIKTDNI